MRGISVHVRVMMMRKQRTDNEVSDETGRSSTTTDMEL